MSIKRKLTFLAVISAGAVLGFSVIAAPDLKNSFCLDCHSDKSLTMTDASGEEVSLYVDKAQLAASAHGTNTCISCHSDATVKHPDDHKMLQQVKCAACHDKPVKLDGTKAHAVKKKD